MTFALGANQKRRFDHDPRWAETGDRYIIKLFRDYVFHQVDENGRPVTDLSHVVTCLNKVCRKVFMCFCARALTLDMTDPARRGCGREDHARV